MSATPVVVEPVTLEFDGVRLEPFTPSYHDILPAVGRVGIGAKKDGVIRHHAVRVDGIVRGEWHEIKTHLHYLLSRHAS